MADAGTSSVPTEIVSAPTSESTSTSYPPCAQNCLADATASLPCDETDSACLCLHASDVESSVTTCLDNSNACSPSEAHSAAFYYNELCLSLSYPTSEGQAASGPILTATGIPTPVSTGRLSPTASEASAFGTEQKSSHHSLSVPTIAGIAAGATFLLVCIITFLVFIYIRRRTNKPSNPTVTIESPDPSNPKNRLRKTVSLRQSALYSLDDPDWNEKLSHIVTLTDDSKQFKRELEHVERKKSLPQTPISPADTLTNNSFTFSPTSYKENSDFNSPLPTLPPPIAKYNASLAPRINTPTRNRPPSITFLPSKHLFEASVSNLSLPASRRISVAQKSPAATEFSDVASIYSATNTHSRTESELSNDNAEDVRVERASTLIMQRSRPTTLEALGGPVEYSPKLPVGSKRDSNLTPNPSHVNPAATLGSDMELKPTRPTLLSHFSSDTTVTSTNARHFPAPNTSSSTTSPSLGSTRTHKPTPLTLNTTTSPSPYSPPSHSKISQNPLSQNPSPTTPKPFTFRPSSSALATPVQASPAVTSNKFTTGHGYTASSTRNTTTTTNMSSTNRATAPITPPANMSLFPPSPRSPVSPVSPISPERPPQKGKQILSGSSFGKFDFEISPRNSKDENRSSFVGSWDFNFK